MVDLCGPPPPRRPPPRAQHLGTAVLAMLATASARRRGRSCGSSGNICDRNGGSADPQCQQQLEGELQSLGIAASGLGSASQQAARIQPETHDPTYSPGFYVLTENFCRAQSKLKPEPRLGRLAPDIFKRFPPPPSGRGRRHFIQQRGHSQRTMR